MMRLFKNPNIDFIGKRKIAFAISGALIIFGIVSLIINGGPKYGIDFTGGTLLELDFTPDNPNLPSINIQEIRNALAKHGFGDAEIQEFGNPNHILVKIKTSDHAEKEKSKVIKILRDEFPKYAGNKDVSVFERRHEHVGAKIGEELRGKAIIAILISLLGIIVYIWWRFELTYGAAAVLALFHDVIITIGIFSIFGRTVNIPVIGALLSIVGYSLNDTIVVFVRIRENMKILRREKYESIVNRSINAVLSRTIITSLTTFVVVLALFIWGGGVIHNFALALLCGVIVGTYSSIFIASPILVMYKNRVAKRAKIARARR